MDARLLRKEGKDIVSSSDEGYEIPIIKKNYVKEFQEQEVMFMEADKKYL